MQLFWLYPAQFYGPFVFDMSVLNYRSGCALVATLKHSQPNIHKQYSQTIKSCLSTLWVNKQESIKIILYLYEYGLIFLKIMTPSHFSRPHQDTVYVASAALQSAVMRGRCNLLICTCLVF